jgi:hypothetical protein
VTDADRDSFIDLKRAVMSRRIQAVAGVIVTIVGGTYAWIEGFDKGLEAAGVDIKKLAKQVEALEGRAAANEISDGEALAQLVAAEQRIAAIAQAEKQRRQTGADEAKQAEKAEYEYWRAIVMSNAPKGRGDAYAQTYKANYGDGHRPMAAAHMTLGWGSAGR